MMTSINTTMTTLPVGFAGADFLDYQEPVIPLAFFDFLSPVADALSQVGENRLIGSTDAGMATLLIQENVDYAPVAEGDYPDDEEADNEAEINTVLTIRLQYVAETGTVVITANIHEQHPFRGSENINIIPLNDLDTAMQALSGMDYEGNTVIPRTRDTLHSLFALKPQFTDNVNIHWDTRHGS